MRSPLKHLAIIGILLATTGCSSQEVPQAHKGRMFDKTGGLALWAGGRGFEGPVLGPGTYFTGLYPEVRMIDCGQRTVKESLTALTKDGVQFNLDIYVRFSANCDDDEAVKRILSTLSPATMPAVKEVQAGPKVPGPDTKNDVEAETIEKFPDLTISSRQIYATYVRAALGESVREAISTYIANEINGKRDELFQKIKDRFNTYLGIVPDAGKVEAKPGDKAPITVPTKAAAFVTIYSINLSNLDFPDQLEKANVDRATQSVLKDKAIAERERVEAEIETTKMRQKLVTNEADNEAARIDAIGAALKRNPEYVALEMFRVAGDKGNMIVVPSNKGTQLLIQPEKK